MRIQPRSDHHFRTVVGPKTLARGGNQGVFRLARGAWKRPAHRFEQVDRRESPAFGDRLSPRRVSARRLVSTVSLVVLLAVSNIPKIARDIPRLQTFHSEKLARYALIREAQAHGLTELELPPLRTRMKVLYSEELKPYNRREENRLFGAYFGWHHPIWTASPPP